MEPVDPGILDGYELEVEDTFPGPDLDRDLWFPHYLPQWSSREASGARYRVDGQLRLVIEADQPPWAPEVDGGIRVSSVQTGVFAGPLGSAVGQSRFAPGLVVREAQEERRLYTPQYGFFEVRAKVSDDPSTMGALWMIGYEDEPERSAEICVFEIFGRDVGPSTVAVGTGLHPWGDPAITDDFGPVQVPIDARAFHDYAVEWTPDHVAFFVDGHRVRLAHQSPAYPMQFMLDVYAFPGPDGELPPPVSPRELVVDRFRGYRPSAG